MQAQVLLEKNDVVIRFPKNLMSQEALSNLLGFIEFTSITQKSQLQQHQEDALAVEVNQVVWKSLSDKENNLESQEQDLLEKERAIHLKPEDMQIFFQALENPPKANAALKNAAKLHKQLFNHA